MNRLILIFSIVFLSFFSLKAQINTDFIDNLGFGGNYHLGYIMPHHPSIGYLLDKNISSYELNISWQTRGEKLWHKIYNYPVVGISYSKTTLSNEDVFGEANIFYYYINAPIRRGKIFSVNYRLGTGFSFVSKPFDIQSNYMNIAIGSRTNIYMTLGLETELTILKKLRLLSGITLNHFSNGNIYRPNLGLNYITLYSGVKYFINSNQKFIDKEIEIKQKSPYTGTILYSMGAKRLYASDKNAFLATSLSATLEKDMNNFFRLGTGIDFFYDSSAKKQLEGEKDEINNIDYYQSGFHISQTVVFNKFSFSIHEGYYLFLKNRINGQKMYNRFSVKYKIANNLIISAAVKSYISVADYIEWGVGYYWN